MYNFDPADLLFYIFSLFAVWILSLVVLAATNTVVGLRHFYVAVLLRIFRWGKTQASKVSFTVNEPSEDTFTSEMGDFIEHTDPSRIRHISTKIPTSSGFSLDDISYFAKSGVESIIDDVVTRRFDAQELSAWNLLTRSKYNQEFVNFKLNALWWIGAVVRYCFLFPLRCALMGISILVCGVSFSFISLLPNSSFRRYLNVTFSLITFRIFVRSLSSVLRFHNPQYNPQSGGIAVANHTSPIDVCVLLSDNCYSLVGQAHSGLIGFVQTALARASSHIWFERGEEKDRLAVAARLQQHVQTQHSPPILIFPEGTCINNTGVMMFKKGSFEIDTTIYPVAIKYDPIFGDPFWNSSKHSMGKHLLLIMTSWALVADIWYLPPRRKPADMTAIEFASEVKAEIAAQGGLVDLDWDGQLKRAKPKPSMLAKQQADYSEVILKRRRINSFT